VPREGEALRARLAYFVHVVCAFGHGLLCTRSPAVCSAVGLKELRQPCVMLPVAVYTGAYVVGSSLPDTALLPVPSSAYAAGGTGVLACVRARWRAGQVLLFAARSGGLFASAQRPAWR